MEALTLSAIAELVDGRVVGDASVAVEGVAGLREAGPGEITFLAKEAYASLLGGCRAAAVIVSASLAPDSAPLPLVIVDDADAAFTRVVEHFTPPEERPAPGVHASAVVEEGAVIGADVSVGPCVVVEAGARIGDRTVLRAGAFVGRDTVVGEDSWLDPGARLLHRVTVGSRCRIGSGTVIGADGFGFLPGGPGGQPRRVPQSGTVVIGDDCDLGACVTVARARFGETRLGRGVKVDCLVMIAHNVTIGDGVILVAQTGIAGSSRLGDGVVFAAQSGVAGHVTVGPGATIAARAGIFSDVAAGVVMAGFPPYPYPEWRRIQGATRRLPDLLRRVRALEREPGKADDDSGDASATPDPR